MSATPKDTGTDQVSQAVGLGSERNPVTCRDWLIAIVRILSYIVVGEEQKNKVWQNKPPSWDEVCDYCLEGKTDEQIKNCKQWKNPTMGEKDCIITLENKLTCLTHMLRKGNQGEGRKIPLHLEKEINLWEKGEKGQACLLRDFKTLLNGVSNLEHFIQKLKNKGNSFDMNNQIIQDLFLALIHKYQGVVNLLQNMGAVGNRCETTGDGEPPAKVAKVNLEEQRGRGTHSTPLIGKKPSTTTLPSCSKDHDWHEMPRPQEPQCSLKALSAESASSRKSLKQKHAEESSETSASQAPHLTTDSVLEPAPRDMVCDFAGIEDIDLDMDSTTLNLLHDVLNHPILNSQETADAREFCKLLERKKGAATAAGLVTGLSSPDAAGTSCGVSGQQQTENVGTDSNQQCPKHLEENQESGYSSGPSPLNDQETMPNSNSCHAYSPSPLPETTDLEEYLEEEAGESNLIETELREEGESSSTEATGSGQPFSEMAGLNFELSDFEQELLELTSHSPVLIEPNCIRDFSHSSQCRPNTKSSAKFPTGSQTSDHHFGHSARADDPQTSRTSRTLCDPVLASHSLSVADVEEKELPSTGFTFTVTGQGEYTQDETSNS